MNTDNPLKRNMVLWTIEAKQDDTPVRGNAMASGDDAIDKQVEDEILQRLDDGDVWAWALVKVTGCLRGLKAETYVGGCNYSSEADFKADGCYEDMQDEVLEELWDMLCDAGQLYNKIVC